MFDKNKYINIKQKRIDIKTVKSVSSLKLSPFQSFREKESLCWKFIYLDEGLLKIYKNNQIYVLKMGDVCFIKPKESYVAEVYGNKASKITVIVYELKDEINRCIVAEEIISLSLDAKDILSALDREFQKSHYISYEHKKRIIVENENSPFATEQLLCNLFEQFYIQVIRDLLVDDNLLLIKGSVRESKDKLLVKEIIAYLHANIYNRITIDIISRDMFLSKTYMQVLFKKEMNISVMGYFKRLKIDVAKILIEEGKLNFTEISDKLGFSSIYHFSRRFKEIEGISPSEYSQVVREVSTTTQTGVCGEEVME